jgi:hypothetical protein
MLYVHHRIETAPRRWRDVAERLATAALRDAGGSLYGIWRSQIGRPRDELTAITVWRDGTSAVAAEATFLAQVPDIRAAASEAMRPTLRPADPTPLATTPSAGSRRRRRIGRNSSTSAPAPGRASRPPMTRR